ncbi:MAG: leucine-rich repeat domain-containing protein [Treponema sp.]|nr:leucine-rich repeat domain-containing protein [Treponema sp.]
MSDAYIKKNGLLYSPDLKTVLGVDDTSSDFTGRVPFGAHYIDDEVFSDCPYESISLPDSLKSLGNALFSNSLKLQKVKLPSSITELSPYLFSGCQALVKVNMPTNLSEFPEGLFYGCSALQDIPFRAGLTKLPENVFAGCTSLKSLVVPGTVKEIQSTAVANCTALESLVLPSSIEYIAEDAFAGCTSLHNIRIDGESNLFFVNKEDGCLYKHAGSGDSLVVKAYGVQKQSVSFFKDTVDDEPIEESEDDEDEEDDFFSAEIGASDAELEIVDMEKEVSNMSDENNLDSMLADIMGEEKARNSVEVDVGVSEQESAVLSETMEVMADSSVNSNTGAVTTDELEKLFSKNESDEMSTQKTEEEVKDPNALDSKTKILTDSVELSKVLTFEPTGNTPEDSDLFVIAEKTVTGADGNPAFSKKLLSCCDTFAKIHDFKRVILLAGLPLDNEEFMQFYFHYINKRNVILACEAASPSQLSDYGKTICEQSRISLDPAELKEQRESATQKTHTLIKLVIRDKYE